MKKVEVKREKGIRGKVKREEGGNDKDMAKSEEGKEERGLG